MRVSHSIPVETERIEIHKTTPKHYQDNYPLSGSHVQVPEKVGRQRPRAAFEQHAPHLRAEPSRILTRIKLNMQK